MPLIFHAKMSPLLCHISLFKVNSCLLIILCLQGQCSFVHSLLRAGVQPTLDPSAETVERSKAFAQERGGKLVGVCECVCDV